MLGLVSDHIQVFPSKMLGNHQKNSKLNSKFGWHLGIKNLMRMVVKRVETLLIFKYRPHQ